MRRMLRLRMLLKKYTVEFADPEDDEFELEEF